MLRPEVSWDITDRNIRYKVFNSCLGYCYSITVIGHKNCSSTVLADCCCVTLMIASQSVAGSWELPESCNWTSPPVCDFVTLCLALLLLVHLLSICKLRDWLSSPMLFFWAKSCEGQATPSAIITVVITMMASHDDAWIAMWFDVQFVHRPSVSQCVHSSSMSKCVQCVRPSVSLARQLPDSPMRNGPGGQSVCYSQSITSTTLARAPLRTFLHHHNHHQLLLTIVNYCRYC